MKQKLFILVLLASNIMPLFACYYVGDAPHNYIYYRVSTTSSEEYHFSKPNYKPQNLYEWCRHTNTSASLNEIEEVVYRYSVDDLMTELAQPTKYVKNNFIYRLQNDARAQKLLIIAKQVEHARAEYQDPWYYPSSPNEHYAPLEQLLQDIEDQEQYLNNKYRYTSEFYLNRYMLQRIRILFSLRRYDECISLWENNIVNWKEGDLMRTMIKDYVAGAYARSGKTDIAKQYYFEQGNYWALADITTNSKSGYAHMIRAIYDYEPNCQDIAAPAMQHELESLRQHYYDETGDDITIHDYYEVMQYIIRTHRSKDMAIWYYTAAYLEDMLDMPKRAANTIRIAEQCQTTDFMRTSIRYLRIYLDAKTRTYDSAYEQQLLTDLRWMQEKLQNNLNDIDNSWGVADEWDIWYNNSRPLYSMSDRGYRLFYPNTMLRKILIGEVAPRMKKAGKQSLSIALTNYADNRLLTWLDPELRHCFFNNFFMAMDTISAAAVEQYVRRAIEPPTELERFLAQGSYIDKDYLYDIAGTHYLRERQYKKAMELLSVVSPTYQMRLHTNYNLTSHDPFSVNATFSKDIVDSKYNFASQMYALEQIFANKQIDINRRANALLVYAIGYKNSFFMVWGLTQYSQGYPVNVFVYEPWMNLQREKTIKQQYQKMRDEAFSLYTDDEAIAAAHMRFQNRFTIVTRYPNTAAAEYIRSHCDTYRDYHP